ncbi:MAG: antiterminator LoaP [Butyrivibrio sp.]|nr:antiterminator LoaP [Butyrivibrio sp.]
MHYVVQVRSGTEESIRIQCSKRIAPEIMERCYIPYYEKKRRYGGAWHMEQRILFPGYVFIISDALEELYTGLKNVMGLTKLIGTGKDIIPLTEQEILLLGRLVNNDGLVELSQGIMHGGNAVITNGPLKGLEGCIRRIDRHKRVAWIAIEMMGRVVETQVGLEILAKE